MTQSLKDVLAKPRRVLLEMAGRPRIEGLILRVEDDNVRLYQRKSQGAAGFFDLPLAKINSVWDRGSGTCVWRKNATTK